MRLCPSVLPLQSPLGHRCWPDRFSSCPTQLHVDLSHTLGCTGVFLPVSNEIYSIYRCNFDLFVGKEWVPCLLTLPPWSIPPCHPCIIFGELSVKIFARFKKLDYFIIKFQDFPIFTSPFQILFLSQDVIFHLSNKYVLESKNVFWWSPIYWCLCFSDIDKKSLPSESHSVVSDSLQPHGLYSPWNSPGQNTGVDSLSLLQGIFPTQGSNPGLPHCRWILYHLNHQGSPRILEWVAYPFSRGSSRPRNQTEVSCTAGGFFTSWAIREAQIQHQILFLFSFRSCVILAFTFRSVIHFG